MCTEIGADFPIFPCDDRLIEYFDGRAIETFTPVESDPDAEYEDIRRIDLGEVVPYVALPHSVPKNCAPVSEIGKQKIHQAFVGSCANGRLEDIAAAAEIVKGKKVVPGVRLIVTPASQRVYMDALRAGYFETLVESGAVVTNSTCGPCYGGSMGIVGAGERCVTSSPRNFKGRMGSSDSEIFLASPATVVASALTGYITDPRDIETR
jgi:3-isopropylmalate/(R)-2-methylmalate dehydratase large subunit